MIRYWFFNAPTGGWLTQSIKLFIGGFARQMMMMMSGRNVTSNSDIASWNFMISLKCKLIELSNAGLFLHFFSKLINSSRVRNRAWTRSYSSCTQINTRNICPIFRLSLRLSIDSVTIMSEKEKNAVMTMKSVVCSQERLKSNKLCMAGLLLFT